MNENTAGQSRFSRTWRFFRRPSAKYSLLTLLIIGFFGGIFFWGGFNTVIHETNSLAFCTSCHEMQGNFSEYKETIHYTNRVGVRAICSDCHVPKEWVPMMIRKAQASMEVWAKITGAVDTPAKFEAKRMEMATTEWKRMEANGSQECRNCHSFEAMKATDQKPLAQKNHAEARAAGKTCIDCHKGIAHLLPKEYRDPNDDE